MASSLSDAEQKELVRLLDKVVWQDRGFIPEGAYNLLHKLVPFPAVEVLVHDQEGRFVLTYRDDRYFTGWHIPGGYMYPDEGFEQACDRHARKDRVARGVKDLKLIATHAWREGEHPFGYPISLIFACTAVGEVKESESVRWFDRVPPDIIVQQHPRFLAFFAHWFDQRSAPQAAILP